MARSLSERTKPKKKQIRFNYQLSHLPIGLALKKKQEKKLGIYWSLLEDAIIYG